MLPHRLIASLTCLLLLLVGCSTSQRAHVTPTATANVPFATLANPGNYGPRELRQAYQVNALLQQGMTGKGQTIIDMVCFGSPTVQSDLDAYSTHYSLPHVLVQVVEPLGPTPPPTDATTSQFEAGWAGETSLDVELYHALAPDAQIVVLAVPVCAPEGIVGLPESRQALQYALDHHLGNIVAVSGGTSEKTLQDQAARDELRLWDALLQSSTTQQGVTYLISSGDNGATDFTDQQATVLADTPTSSFPADSPWVTSVGGTSLTFQGATSRESTWNTGGNGGATGGGFSAFYPQPSYQNSLPTSTQQLSQGHRGLPDVAAVADPATGVSVMLGGIWHQHVGGTSIAAPIWAGIIAIADQAAGKPLGFINPALYRIGLSARAAQDFHDVTVGNNSIAGAVTVTGFQATPGWDPVTGWGTPDVANLIPDLIKDAQG